MLEEDGLGNALVSCHQDLSRIAQMAALFPGYKAELCSGAPLVHGQPVDTL